MQLPPNFIFDLWPVTCNLWSAKQTCLTSWPEVYFRKTLYFLVSQQNIDLKTSKHEFTDRTHQNKQGFEGKKLRGTDQNTCARPWRGIAIYCFLTSIFAFVRLVILQNPSKLFAWLVFGWNSWIQAFILHAITSPVGQTWKLKTRWGLELVT